METKEEIKGTLYADVMVLGMKNSANSNRKLLNPRNTFIKLRGENIINSGCSGMC